MYKCTYVYSMILLYLEGSGSKIHSVNTKTSQFSSFFGFQELRKKHVNTKTSQFLFFGFQELRKNMCIYIYVYVNYFQPFPHILWVAQLPMGFHLAPKTPVDARNAMFSHQTFLHVYSNPFQRRHCFQGHLYISYMPMIPSFYMSKCTLHTYIYNILIYYIIPSSSPKL